MTSYQMEMLPIEVNQIPFQASLQEGLAANISRNHFLLSVQSRLSLVQNQVKMLSPSLPLEKLEADYIRNRRNLAILQQEIVWILQTYKKKEQETDGEALLSRLRLQEQEILLLLEEFEKFLAKQYSALPSDTREVFCNGITAMQERSLSILESQVLSIPSITKDQGKMMSEQLLEFCQNSLKQVDPLIHFISRHWQEWHLLRLKSARGLLIEETYDPNLTLLITQNGDCYPLFATIGNLVGVGAHKMVIRSICLKDGQLRAIVQGSIFNSLPEVPTKEDPAWFKHLWKESYLLQKIKNSKGVIHLHHTLCFQTTLKKQLFLVEDYYWEGSLQGYFNRSLYENKSAGHTTLSNTKKEKIAEDLLQGLVSLHENGILHNDLKPDNILLNEKKESIEAVITDFHMACFETKEILPSHRMLCRASVAPPEYAKMILSIPSSYSVQEVLSFGIDLWGLGLILLTLFTNEMPPWLSDFLKTSQNPSELIKSWNQESIAELDASIFKTIASLPEHWIPKKAQKSPYYPLFSALLATDLKKRVSATRALALFYECKSK